VRTKTVRTLFIIYFICIVIVSKLLILFVQQWYVIIYKTLHPVGIFVNIFFKKFFKNYLLTSRPVWSIIITQRSNYKYGVVNMNGLNSGRFDSFYALEPEKRQRILDAALDEFALKGFKLASTNTIAANAQIGKGMLFYYFGSKEELFNFLCEYTVEFARDRYIRQFKTETRDFLERYIKLTDIKRAAIREWPKVIAFFESFYHKENAEYFYKYIKDTQEIRESIIGSIYEDVDYSLFRSGIDGQTAMRYIKWLFDAYEKDVIERFKRSEVTTSKAAAMEAEWERFGSFTSDLRKLFYK